MTILDDFEARWKLEGVRILDVLIEKAPSDLLKRTGLDQLTSKVCIACMRPVTLYAR